MYRSVKLMLSLTLAGLTLAAVYLTALALGNLLNVSKSSTDAGYPAIAVSPDGQNIGIVWAERDGTNAAQGSIYLKGSTDGASLSTVMTVDEAETLNPGDDQSWQPDIAVDPLSPSVMHVVWKNRKNAQDDYIYYARCPLTSTCQTEQIDVVPDSGNDSLDYPKIAITDNGSQTTKHAVWQFIDGSAGTREIMYSRKVDNGAWSSASSLSSSAYTATHPAIAASTNGDDHLHVVWATNNDIRYCRVLDGSPNCGVSKTLPMPYNGSLPDFPAVVAMTDTVVVLWDVYKTGSDPNDYYAVYVASTDNGDTFEIKPRDIPDGNQVKTLISDELSDPTVHRSDDGVGVEDSFHAQRLQLQATIGANGVVHAVWHETTVLAPGEYRHDVHYGYLDFGGAGGNSIGSQEGGWNDTPLTTKWGTHSSNAYSMSPDIAVDNSGQQFLAYMEGADDFEYKIINPGTYCDPLTDCPIDVIYDGAVELVDNTLDIYLPIITKNAP